MTWTAPMPPELDDGPFTGEDRPILEAFLHWQRRTLLALCAGLTGEQLVRRALPTSNLSLLGLVRHMAKVERTWFRQRVAADGSPSMYDPGRGADADFDDLDPARAPEDIDRFVRECAAADDAVRGLPSDSAFELRGQACSLRFVYVHMLAEYARHNGHADLLREAIDGTTGV